MTRPLPQPARSRWQPLRAGLIDMFYYDSQEFWFHDGRLLLRGNNGTGKSKVLALTLPLLLDGDLSPHRVEPDADPKKRMDWNLLLGGAHPYPERLGYTWLEFGRLDERHGPQFRTLGCGLKAVTGRGIARHWFFATSRRPGADLALVDFTGTALTRERLVDALGDDGTVYDRARDYRRAVDETLFGFGEQRYGALVDLLVQLRQPQLSKRPSETALSSALTEALPPLDQAVVADVAEAFRSLEEDREALAEMTEAREAADSFLGHYRRYARIATKRRAAQPRTAQGAYERVTRDLAVAEADLGDAERSLTAARDRLTDLTSEHERLQAREAALRASPEMRSARELDLAAEEARRLTAEAARLEGELARAGRQLRTQQDRHAEAQARVRDVTARLGSARRSATDAAAAAGIGSGHARRVDGPLDAEPDLAALRRDAGHLADTQQRAVRLVSEHIDAAEEAERQVTAGRRRITELDAEVDDLARRRSDADDTLEARAEELVADWRRHLAEATELHVADEAATLAELRPWSETLHGPNPATAAASAAAQAAADELAVTDAALLTRERDNRRRHAEVADEIARLERGEDGAPPPPYTRDAAARERRPGAPLWQLVDFADGVREAERAAVEAALEASGVLDAWVTPHGEALARDTADVVVRPGDPAPVGLDTLLRPDVDRDDDAAAAVSDEALAALLSTISVGEHGHTWITTDGRFRLGPLEGAWHKPAATYIGRTAREAARRARLAVLRADLLDIETGLATITGERQQLGHRKATLARELGGLPPDSALREAHATVTALVREHERLSSRRATAAAALAAALAAADQASATLAEVARDTDLPAGRPELSLVDEALQRYRVDLAALWPSVEALREASQRAAETAHDLELAGQLQAELAGRRQATLDEAAAAREHHETLRDTVGAAVAELQQRLADVAERLRENGENRAGADRDREAAIEARGTATGRHKALAEQLEAAAEERSAAAESFRRFAATGLISVALPELELPDPHVSWAPDPAVRLARRVNEPLGDVSDDDATWDRAQSRVNAELKTLHDTLSRHGNRASADLRDDGVVVHVDFRGRPMAVPELAAALAVEMTDRRRLLNEREREILENHLVNEVASTLQELIMAAEAQVATMNEELEARPTSTGMRLRLLWRARDDGPPGVAAARERLLRQAADAWSEEDRAAVGGFLQARIAEVRARNATGTWLEHLTEALDYRTWNRFVIQRHQNGQWRPATGPASGGERVLAASVPLFAAASAHYASAGNPHAARLVTLDEAFAGVDDNARAKYLGLLAAFDLDVVMTSEREWGCYPEVPGLAISQLSRVDDIPAVLVTNWVWDGAGRVRVDRPEPLTTAGVDGAEPATVPQHGLWE